MSWVELLIGAAAFILALGWKLIDRRVRQRRFGVPSWSTTATEPAPILEEAKELLDLAMRTFTVRERSRMHWEVSPKGWEELVKVGIQLQDDWGLGQHAPYLLGILIRRVPAIVVERMRLVSDYHGPARPGPGEPDGGRRGD